MEPPSGEKGRREYTLKPDSAIHEQGLIVASNHSTYPGDMTRKHGLITFIAAIAITVGLAGAAAAHEGHAHKVMGTITMAAADHIMVKTVDEKTKADKVVTITVNDKTKIFKGTTTTPATLKDVTEGLRVVVDVGAGKEPLTAREIRLGTAAHTAQKTAAPHTH
jgi:hypothetical protein